MFKRSEFPTNFVFGAATSAYQIEGHRFGGAGQTHWDTFAATPGNVVRAEHGGTACDHYHRYETDLDLVAQAGLNAYRFSTSWARVLPNGRGLPNPEGLDFYDRLVDACLDRGLAPHVTLYHWELPAMLADLGGWRNRDIALWFADFTETIMARIGDRVASAAPINEPWCVSWLSHFLGHHAPGLRDIRAAVRSMHHVLLAHGYAISVMREMGVLNLGGVFNMEWATPASDAAPDQAAAARHDAYYNRFFVEGILRGEYPDELQDAFLPHLPENWTDDFAVITQPLDWIGLNYYTRKVIADAPGTPWPALREKTGDLPQTQMGWEIYPEGLEKFLLRLCDLTGGNVPIMITENGMASATEFDDRDRIAYLQAHFAAAKRAIDAGVPLTGYFIWSLMDNYEWAEGYEKRFGLVHVDFDSLQRTPKSSYDALKAALQR